MPSVQEELFDETVKDAKMIGQALMNKIMNALHEQAAKRNGKMARELLSFTDKGGRLALLNCQTFCSKEFLDEFDRSGIPYMKFMTNKSRNVSILIKNDPETIQKATMVRDAFLVKRGTYYQEVSPLAMYHACQNGNMVQIKGLTENELHVLRDKSFHMKNGFTIASQENGDGSFTVFLHPKDSYNTEKSGRTDMAEALVSMKISLHGENDSIKSKQVEYDMEIQNKVINFDYKNGRDLFVVDMQRDVDKTNYLHLSQDGMEYVSRYKRKDDIYEKILSSQVYDPKYPAELDHYNEEIVKDLHSMNDMRIMSSEEFEEYKKDPEKFKVLRPEKNEQELEIAEKEKAFTSDIVKLCRQRTEQSCEKIMALPPEERDYLLFDEYLVQLSKLSREDVSRAIQVNGLDSFNTDKYLEELHSIGTIERDSLDLERAPYEDILEKQANKQAHRDRSANER